MMTMTVQLKVSGLTMCSNQNSLLRENHFILGSLVRCKANIPT